MAMQQTYISQNTNNPLDVWVFGCPHVNRDFDDTGLINVDVCASQLQSIGVTADMAVCTGDFDSNQYPPTLSGSFPAEGVLVANALQNVSKLGMTRNDLYTIAGNHDGGAGEMDWFNRYVDPLGENTAYSGVSATGRGIVPMEEGAWHSYYKVVGKHLFLFLSDRNDLPYPYGRFESPEVGGHPSGAITKATWEWAKSVILANKNKNIFMFLHQNPRDTTIGTGDGDGSIPPALHGSSGITEGNGATYSIYDEDTETADSPTTQIVDFFADNPDHTVVICGASHSHGNLNEFVNGKNERSDQNGVTFLNIGHLTAYHNNSGRVPAPKMSKFFEIRSKSVKVKHFNHDTLGGEAIGFYEPLEYNIPLKV